MTFYDSIVALLFLVSVLWAAWGFATWKSGGSKEALAGSVFALNLGNVILARFVSSGTSAVVWSACLTVLFVWFVLERRKSRVRSSGSRSAGPA